MIKCVYIDTSVFGGYFEDEFKEDTVPFFKEIKSRKIKILISELLEVELYRAPDEVKKLFQSLPDGLIKRIKLTEEARALADKYISENVVGKASRADCQHIALATINCADVLVSWNFKHIVNLERIRGYNAVNFKEGYQMTEIRTPKEIFPHED